MHEDLRTDELLRSYLLGELPEEGVDRLEERLIEDDGLFELCEAVEADLLAAYDQGELTGLDSERVHRLASSPAGRERLALARALNRAARESDRTAASVVPFRRRAFHIPRLGNRWAALAATVLLAFSSGYWFARFQENDHRRYPHAGIDERVSNGRRLPANGVRTADQERSEARVVQGSEERKRQTKPEDFAKGKMRPAPPPERPGTYVMALSLAVLRGAEDVEEFRIPPGKELVEIQIDLEGLEDQKSFHAAVRSKENGTTVWEKDDLAPKRLDWGTALVLEIPADRLPSGRYEVAVDELTKDFEVVREMR